MDGPVGRGRWAFLLAVTIALWLPSSLAIEAKCSAYALNPMFVLSLVSDPSISDAALWRPLLRPALQPRKLRRVDLTSINNEMDLDMRGRLDGKGVRYGKKVAYKQSELRVVELLDGVCAEVKTKFTLSQLSADSMLRWVPLANATADDNARATASPGYKDRLQSTLETYCGHILDEHEEGLALALQGSPELVSDELCAVLAGVCKPRERVGAAGSAAEATRPASGEL